MAFHRIVESALAGEAFELYGDGCQTRDFTYVADVVDATIAAAERGEPGGIYNIGGGARISMRDVLDILRAELGELTVVEHESQRGQRPRHGGRHHPRGGGARLRPVVGRPPPPARAGGLAPRAAAGAGPSVAVASSG